MADKETGLNIPVSAIADKDSAKEAVNELTKGVLSSLKDGYIEIPAELKVPIKGASKDLEKAQKDVINQWEKTFKQGFSSSAKDLDNLTAAYQRFKKLAGQQHKANTKQSRGISAIMGEPIQAYSMSKREAQARGKEIRKELEKAQKRNTKQNITSEERKLLKEEIDNAIKQENKRRGYDKLSKELSRGTSRARGSTPGADINLGLRRPSMSSPYMDAKSLRMSEISPYRNVDEIRRAKEQQEIRARERASLTSRRATSEDIEDVDKRLKQREASGRSQSGTEYELIKKALLTELAKLQGGLIKGKPDATSQKLIDQVFANLAYDEDQGVDPIKSVMGIHNMLQKRYDTKGKIGTTDGTIKGEGPNQEEANETLKQIYKILGQFIDSRQSLIDNVRNIRDNLSSRTSTSRSLYSQELGRITGSDQIQAMKDALTPTNGLLTRTLSQNTREGTREGAADQAAGRSAREANAIATDTLEAVTDDANTGLNSDKSTNDLVGTISAGFTDLFNVLSEIRDVLQPIKTGGIGGNGSISGKNYKKPKIHGLPTDVVINPETGLFYRTKAKGQRGRKPKIPQLPTVFSIADEQNQYEAARRKRLENSIEEERAQIEKGEHPSQQRQFLEPSEIFTTQKGIFGQLRKVFKDMMPQTEVDRIMSMNAEEQARMRAERIETYGLNRGRQLTDTGDIADVKRTKSLFGWIYKNDERNKELFQDVKLTPGFTGENAIDTTAIMGALNKVLSGSEMFKAQTGGTLRNIIGSFTGYIGMPSIEKSRAQAEGLNQVMANVRNEVLGLIQDIQAKEATLIGMQERGTARFDRNGYITDDSSLAAKNTFTKLEEQKQVLASALAEVGMIDKVVDKTGGKVKDIIKNLGFVMPELMQNNTILQNINAGLDKNGKALKFQTRLAEILNYSFQLMSRHIGQILKNWLWMINPLNVIKKLFDDFGSYDPKWQRTMNVIKNNFREIILPFMEKIAQTLVNIIGFFDIISMKIQEAFGYTPISLFDQQNANDFKKTYEEIQNVTASFDELHDIGSSGENDPNNLLGEIYKPQLSQGWIDLANEIGDLFAGLIKGDLGFGDVMKRILQIVWDGLQQIWEWFKGTKLGQWLVENWKTILATMLGIFLTWKLLKIAGPMILKALFGGLTAGSVGGIFSKVGGWITKALSGSAIGRGVLQGFTDMLTGQGGLVKSLKFAFTKPNLISQMGGWGEMLGMIFVQGLTAILGGTIAVAGISTGYKMNANNTAYNIGLEEAGGNEEDKKSNFWGTALGTATGGIGGGIVAGALFGSSAGPIGTIVGAVSGFLISSLAPAIETVTVKGKEMNNELLKIEQYEGRVQGATTEVEEFTEVQNQMSQALESQTNKIYAQGEQLGISKTRMDELVASVQNGTYHTGMLSDTEMSLAGNLEQLSALQAKNKEATDQLTEAKRKLQAAEMDLAIAQDIEAGHYEVAAARIEAAFTTGTYTAEEAGKQMAMLLKQVNGDMKANLLENMTPEMRKNFLNYVNTTDQGKKDLVKIYDELSEEAKEALSEDYSELFGEQIQGALDEGQKVIDNTELDWSHPFQSLGKVLGNIWDLFTGGGNTNSNNNNSKSVKTASFAVGTNYVPNDGLAYLHQGEAVIPKKYNQPYQPNTMDRAYVDQIITTVRALDNTIKQGINVKGEFRQKGTDLVATVKKVENRNGNQPLNNPVFAR